MSGTAKQWGHGSAAWCWRQLREEIFTLEVGRGVVVAVCLVTLYSTLGVITESLGKQ